MIFKVRLSVVEKFDWLSKEEVVIVNDVCSWSRRASSCS